VECERLGIVKAAEHVDHIEPHDGDLEKFWNQDNWQGLCASHHSRKTRRERVQREKQ
jgi:5-methylcytosine-specific restriction protein A